MSEKSNTASDRILAQIRTTPGETVDQMIGRVRQEFLDENPPTWQDRLPPEEAARQILARAQAARERKARMRKFLWIAGTTLIVFGLLWLQSN